MTRKSSSARFAKRPDPVRAGAVLLVLAGALSLQGCAAALLPVAAAGLIGKHQIDAAARTRRAEADVQLPGGEPGQSPSQPVVTVGGAEPDKYAARPGVLPIPGNNEYAILTARSMPSPSRHPFLNFSSYALAQAQRRDQGLAVQSAVLVQKVSLANPETVACGAKPLAVIIDLDAAQPAVQSTESLTRPLGSLLEDMRDAGLRLIWISGRGQAEVASTLDPLRQGDNPAIKAEDLISLQEQGRLRKQERRWNLAGYYCIAAVAGDQNSDFDELFDYLRNPDYAISLGKFWNRGWFVVPHPASVAAPEIEDLTRILEEPE
jgi:hypothetical protein